MKQSKKGSLAESLTNVAIGYSVAVLSNMIVLPSFGYNVSTFDSFAIGVVFTGISLVRSYVIRRLYNKYNWFSKS